MLFSSKDPIENDDEAGEDPAEEATETGAQEAAEHVVEHRVITRHGKTGKIISNVRHPHANGIGGGSLGRPKPPHGSAAPSGGSGGSFGAKADGMVTGGATKMPTGMAPSGGSSKPGSMGPVKDGRAKIASIMGKMRQV